MLSGAKNFGWPASPTGLLSAAKVAGGSSDGAGGAAGAGGAEGDECCGGEGVGEWEHGGEVSTARRDGDRRGECGACVDLRAAGAQASFITFV